MNIALMSHDNKKDLMVQFCTAYAGILFLKLEDVVKVEVLEPEDCSNSELLLIKVRAEGQQGRAAVLRTAQNYGARILDISDASMTVEMTGQTREMDGFIRHMEPLGILEMARTGITALARGDCTILEDD